MGWKEMEVHSLHAVWSKWYSSLLLPDETDSRSFSQLSFTQNVKCLIVFYISLFNEWRLWRSVIEDFYAKLYSNII